MWDAECQLKVIIFKKIMDSADYNIITHFYYSQAFQVPHLWKPSSLSFLLCNTCAGRQRFSLSSSDTRWETGFHTDVTLAAAGIEGLFSVLRGAGVEFMWKIHMRKRCD